MDRRVQFLRATLTDDGFGQVATFANHGQPVPAERRDISDGERWRAGETQATLMTRFRVRWSAFAAGITPKDRLTTEGQTFDIVGIKQLDRRRALEITAAARIDQ
jgi:head-tail adaptor